PCWTPSPRSSSGSSGRSPTRKPGGAHSGPDSTLSPSRRPRTAARDLSRLPGRRAVIDEMLSSDRPVTCPARALPAVPVDHLVEGPPVGPGERPERPVGRVDQGDQGDGGGNLGG